MPFYFTLVKVIRDRLKNTIEKFTFILNKDLSQLKYAGFQQDEMSCLVSECFHLAIVFLSS